MRIRSHIIALIAVAALTPLIGCKSRSAEERARPATQDKGKQVGQTQCLEAVGFPVSVDNTTSLTTSVRDYRTIAVTSNQFVEIVSKANPAALWRIRQFVLPELFNATNAYRLDELLERLVQSYTRYGLNVTGSSFGSAACALRYRALLPYVRDTLLAYDITNNPMMASVCRNLIHSTAHADALRTWIEVERRLPVDSTLRAGTNPQWTSNPPLFMRNDCLDIYLDMANHPERHTYAFWHGAVEYLSYFTNDSAVASLQTALTIVKAPGKYWPGMKPSMDIMGIEELVKDQQDFAQGKRGPINMDRDKPFDE